MKLLLLYLFVTFVLAVRSASRGRPPRTWPLLLGSVVVGLSYLSLRVV